MPSVSQGLIQGSNAACKELVTGIGKLVKGGGNLGPCCLEELFIIYDVIIRRCIVLGKAVVLAVNPGLGCGELAVG